jgi:stearoyl-CoA desaturase (delta-9 desaturase)
MVVVKNVRLCTSIEKQDREVAAGTLPSPHEELPAPAKPKPGILALSRAAQTLSVNWLVLGFMLLFHLCAIAALFFFSWSALIVAVALHVVAINMGIGMGYHRLLTHRGYQVPRWLEYFLAVCATLSLEGGPLVWVATHRVHHQHTDKAGDPHSPREGGWWSHAGWVIHGSGADAEPLLLARYAPDLMKNDFYRWLNHYHWVPLTLLAFVLLAVGFVGHLPASDTGPSRYVVGQLCNAYVGIPTFRDAR